MADIKTYEPLWGTWYVETLLGEGGFGKVYKVRQEEFGKTYYSAVKIISIPRDEDEIRQMRYEGFDDASMHQFLHAFVLNIISEIDLMRQFRGTSHIVSLEDHKIIKKDGFGWDILIRMELLTNLFHHAMQNPPFEADVVKLGIHICRALELCIRKNTIHRDIKPDNIFISPHGEYKLGDFGIARQLEGTMSGLSKKGTYTYMAPEVFRGEHYGPSVDTYSLGIVLYRFLNQNRIPFMPGFPQPIVPHHRDEALQRRMGGERLPDLKGVRHDLNAIVQKACAFNRHERFVSPTEMREALEAVATLIAAQAANAITVESAPEEFSSINVPTTLEGSPPTKESPVKTPLPIAEISLIAEEIPPTEASPMEISPIAEETLPMDAPSTMAEIPLTEVSPIVIVKETSPLGIPPIVDETSPMGLSPIAKEPSPPIESPSPLKNPSPPKEPTSSLPMFNLPRKNRKMRLIVLVSGTLIIIGAIVFIVIVILDGFNLNSHREPDLIVSSGDQGQIEEQEEPEYVKGTITETGWESEYLNLKFTAPEGYAMEAEKAPTSSNTVEMEASVPGKTKLLLGVNAPSLSKITEEDYLENMKLRHLRDKDRNYSVNSEIVTVEVAGKNYKQLSFRVKTQSGEVFQDYLVCKVDDRLVYIIISYNNKADRDTLLKAFITF